MAGMFYSLQEAADKLGMSQEDVKQLATEGKLREFRDGSNIMFKIDEVESLLAPDESEQVEDFDLAFEPGTEANDSDEFQDLAPDEEELEEASDDVLLEPVEEDADVDELASLEGDALTLEPDMASEDAATLDEDLDALLGFADEDGDAQEAAPAEMSTEDDDLAFLMDEGDDELSLVEQEPDMAAAEGDSDLGADLSDTQVVANEPEADKADDEDIFLAADASGLADGTNELTNMDTALSGEEGINLLGETDGDFKLTDDTMAETLAGLGATGETSLEEIEDDLSLDSFGSGSGLLDLSLQADDTSLGGILDEIYTSDGDEGSPGDDGLGSASDVMGESETLPVDAGVSSEEAFMPAAMPMVVGGAEVPADASSRMLGGLLFIPLFIMLYTSIIAISGMSGNVPSVLTVVKPWIWYIMGGLILVAIILSAVAMTKSDGPKAPRAKKAKKAKAPKKEKAAKEPKPKKEKKPKKKK
jgi:hypothetical protein